MQRIFGQHDEATLTQLETCAREGDSPHAVLCADGHLGYSAPIGSAIAYTDYVSPSGVGYDIACGNKAVCTDVMAKDFDVVAVMDEINRRISFGVGRKNDEPIDHQVLDEIGGASIPEIRALRQKAASQLGTVGAGNHYVDLFADDDGRLWVGVHFGSRGFGHTIASGFLAIAEGKPFGEKVSEGEMMSPPKLIALGTPAADAYIEAMELAGRYAYAGRDTVVAKVLEILGNPAVTDEVHNHHNFAWLEQHGDLEAWVIRKGSTPLFPGQLGFVGSTMGEDSVILEGVEHEDGAEALYSAPHGAGRAMSRMEAAGKRRKRWACTNRDCEWIQPPRSHKPEACPRCGTEQLTKRWVQERPGRIDYTEVQRELGERGIELRGGAADEAPGAYKRLPEVLAEHGNAVRVRNVLHPIGVCMAGLDTFDPFKD